MIQLLRCLDGYRIAVLVEAGVRLLVIVDQQIFLPLMLFFALLYLLDCHGQSFRIFLSCLKPTENKI